MISYIPFFKTKRECNIPMFVSMGIKTSTTEVNTLLNSKQVQIAITSLVRDLGNC